jgi:D-inositol-3-phosphate glycosyltransferase
LRLLVIGGDGAEELPAIAQGLGIAGRVAFAGRVEQANLPSYYAVVDVVAVPSSYESFGLVALEALACGTPAVATAVGAMEDVLGGDVIRDPSPEAFAGGLERVLSAGPLSEEQRSALRRSVARYDWSHVASAVLGEYEDLLGRSKEVSLSCAP